MYMFELGHFSLPYGTIFLGDGDVYIFMKYKGHVDTMSFLCSTL